MGNMMMMMMMMMMINTAAVPTHINVVQDATPCQPLARCHWRTLQLTTSSSSQQAIQQNKECLLSKEHLAFVGASQNCPWIHSCSRRGTNGPAGLAV
jgi:hypothetical protein